MYKKIASIIALAASSNLNAGTMGLIEPENPWYVSIGTGFAWSRNAGISNPDPNIWDFSIQGYDSSLGDRGFYTFEVGKQIYPYINVSLLYINPENFNYEKFQTGFSNTPGFTGINRVRYFTLDNRALLVNIFLQPTEAYCTVANVGITPFIGVGIGYARNKVYDFHTVSSDTVDGATIGSTTTIGLSDANKNAFSWQGSVGVNFNPNMSHLSVDLGYRYYDGGKFEGPSATYSQSGGFAAAPPWQGRLKTNQIFVDFKYTV